MLAGSITKVCLQTEMPNPESLVLGGSEEPERDNKYSYRYLKRDPNWGYDTYMSIKLTAG